MRVVILEATGATPDNRAEFAAKRASSHHPVIAASAPTRQEPAPARSAGAIYGVA